MGLSNHERTSYVFNAIDELAKLSQKLAKCNKDDETNISSLIAKLWPVTIGALSNSGHWLLGSSASNQVDYDSMSPFSVALMDGFDNDHRDMDENLLKLDDYDDPLDNFTISNLTKESNAYGNDYYSIIYEIFAWTEQLCYGLRRYDDEYLKGLSALSDIIAQIQGACFPVFSDVIFRKAYLAKEIVTKIYSRVDNSKLFDVFEKVYLHHNLRGFCDREMPIEKLYDWHKRLSLPHTEADRLYVAFEMMGRRLHDKFKFDEIIKALDEKKVKYDKSKLDLLFKKACEEDAKNKKESGEEHCERHDEEHFFAVHRGFLRELRNDKLASNKGANREKHK